MKVTMKDVLNHLDKVAENIATDKPLIDLNGVLPMNDHHQTAVFIRLPYPGALEPGTKVYDRITKLLSSINRPDTIKCDVFTIVGGNCIAGYQPHIEHVKVDGEEVTAPLFDPNWLMEQSMGYTLQVTVDLVSPDVMCKAMGIEYKPEEWTPEWAAQKLKGNMKISPFKIPDLDDENPFAFMDEDEDE